MSSKCRLYNDIFSILQNFLIQGETVMSIYEVDWDDALPKGSGSGKGLFLSMKEPGDYQVRIVSLPHKYLCHWVDTSDGSRKKINCMSSPSKEVSCSVCNDFGKGPQHKYLLKVIHRTATGSQLCLLDAGQQILKGILDLHNDETYGNVSKYDIKIKKGPRNTNPLYHVLPVGSAQNPVPLTEEEKQMVRDSKNPESEKYIDIDRMCEPSTQERVNKALGLKKTEDAPEDKGFDAASDEDFLELE